MKTTSAVIFAVLLANIIAIPAAGSATVSFEERVRAQEALDRIAYSHQTGVSRPFEEAVPHDAIERKVRRYLKQSTALESLWKTSITSAALQREIERMAAGTKMPDRLSAIFEALDNDPVKVAECLARPLLADRLTRNFFAYDAVIHADARRQAEELQAGLAHGREPIAAPNVIQVRRTLTTEAFLRLQAQLASSARGIAEVVEERDRFVVRWLLPGEAETIVEHSVLKRSWDDWWSAIEGTLSDSADRIEDATYRLPAPRSEAARLDTPAPACGPDNSWDSGALAPTPPALADHTVVWTGTEMIVWGGGGTVCVKNAFLYDPATDTWRQSSTNGAPVCRSEATSVWTGTEMIVWGGLVDSGQILGTGGRYNPLTDSWSTVATGGLAPAARWGHTAVWTGTVMVIWGGEVAPGMFRFGGRYNPATNTWQRTSTTNEPGARFLHSAVWDGSRMIVWGGSAFNSADYLTGGRYDPVANTWTATSTVGAPAARWKHSAVWTGSRMIVWGGASLDTTIHATGGSYDPVANAWTPVSTTGAPAARFDHTAVWTGNRMVVWGGNDVNFNVLGSGGRYDPVLESWSSTAPTGAPSARYAHTAVWNGSRMIVWGGFDSSGAGTDTGGRYDPTGDAWTPTATPAAPPPAGLGALWTGIEMIVWANAAGGSVVGHRYSPLFDAWSTTPASPVIGAVPISLWAGERAIVWGQGAGGRFDPIQDSWLPISNVNSPWAHFPSVVWTGQHMLLWGGHHGKTYPYAGLNTGGRYNPVSDAWSTMAPAPLAGRFDHTAVWTGSQMIVWGGRSLDYTQPPYPLETIYGDGARYDASLDTWTLVSATGAPEARADHTAVWAGSRMVVWGGGEFLSTGGRYDPVANAWTATSTSGAPLGRRFHTAVSTGSRMAVWGGLVNWDFPVRPTASGGLYEPAIDEWTAISTDGDPYPRSGHFAFWTGSFMLVWGGTGWDNAPTSDGGRWAYGHSADDDGDGISECGGDCNDANGTVWGTPGEARNLSFQDATTLQWSPPLTLGGSVVSYDVLRASAASDFDTLGSCADINGADTLATIALNPPPGEVHFYLVRARNACGLSGPLGTASSGAPRAGRDCP